MPELFRIILFLGLFSKAGITLAQTLPLLRYTIKDGLPSNTIYSITRDSKGFLWFPSDKGISRFDGINFQNFSTFDGLPDNEIFNIKEDYSGRLWMATYSGDLCYYQDGIFHTSANTPWLKLPVKSPIFRVFLQPDSSICFILNDLDHFINIKGSQVSRYKTARSKLNAGNTHTTLLHVSKLSPALFQFMYEDEKIDMDTLGRIIKRQGFLKNEKYFYISTLSIADQKRAYFLREDGIYSLSEELLFPICKLKINAALPIPVKVKNENFYIGWSNGININDDIHFDLGKQVTYIEDDLAGNVWIATKGQGLYCLNRRFSDLKQYDNSYKRQVVYAKIVNGILFYVNNQGTLYKVKGERVKSIFDPQKGRKENEEGYLYRGNFLINDHYDFFQFFCANFLMVSGINGERLKEEKDIALRWQDYSNTIVKEVLTDGQHIYIANNHSVDKISYLDFVNKNIKGAKRIVDFQDKQNIRILAKALHKDGSFWFSTFLGLSKIIGDKVINLPDFKNISFRQIGFYGDYLIGITEKNKLLICSNYNGKIKIDSVQSNNCIWENIYPIDNNHAIISTNNFNRLLTLYAKPEKGKPVYHLNAIEDPFVPVQTEFIVADTQNCYFFKEGTLTQIATKLLFEKTIPPVPTFLSLNTRHNTYPINNGGRVTLAYNDSKSLRILFENIAFVGKEINCQYSISENEVDNWSTITSNEINLNTPGYGTYYIKIRTATLSSGFSAPAIITITVLRPFWATWWFITGVIIALILAIWGIIAVLSRRRTRKQQKEHESDMKYQQSEYKALNALMNPHFIFNSLNNIQGLINKNDKLVANQYLVIFSDLIRQNMHNISKGFITLQEELTLVENYLNLEKLRFKEFISHSITVAGDVETDLILIPPLMIQPLVENAVKHGLLPKQSIDNRVSIKVFESLDRLYIEIEDNGVGLTYASKYKSNHLHDSFGLSNLQKRIDYLKKIQEQEINVQVVEILDNSGKALGTRATVTMELGQKGQGL